MGLRSVVRFDLWHAVDQDGEVIDVFLQARRDSNVTWNARIALQLRYEIASATCAVLMSAAHSRSARVLATLRMRMQARGDSACCLLACSSSLRSAALMRQNCFRTRPSSCALVLPARWSWMSRAARTRARTLALDSGAGPSCCSGNSRGRLTSRCRSMRSSRGPEMRPRYLLTCSAEQ